MNSAIINSSAYQLLRKFYFRVVLRTPKRICSYCYKKVLGEELNWENPQTLNEKINWLKFNSDTSSWSRLADKYLVRDYLKEKGLEHLLVPLYGKWDKPEDIDFDSLPNQFVMKTNHGSGEIIIVKEKTQINEDEIRAKMKKYLSYTYGYYQGEPHYMKIKPCIIAEAMLVEKENTFSTSLVDYKVWCFHGKPYCVWACYSRTEECTYVGSYDLDWNYHPEHSIFTDHYRDGGPCVTKPRTFDEMMAAAAKLSEGYPEVRVDFYDVDGKLYFGEMTFTGAGGFMPFYTKEYQLEMGKQIKLK